MVTHIVLLQSPPGASVVTNNTASTTMPQHGSLTKAGKVKNMTPVVQQSDFRKRRRPGRAGMRDKFERRFKVCRATNKVIDRRMFRFGTRRVGPNNNQARQAGVYQSPGFE